MYCNNNINDYLKYLTGSILYIKTFKYNNINQNGILYYVMFAN